MVVQVIAVWWLHDSNRVDKLLFLPCYITPKMHSIFLSRQTCLGQNIECCFTSITPIVSTKSWVETNPWGLYTKSFVVKLAKHTVLVYVLIQHNAPVKRKPSGACNNKQKPETLQLTSHPWPVEGKLSVAINAVWKNKKWQIACKSVPRCWSKHLFP